MEAAISDPYHLATYSTHSRGSPSAAVSTTFTSVPGADGGWVTVTVQGDGIHVIDLSSLQPVTSHTLGPSTFFSAPAVTTLANVTAEDGAISRKLRTYAAITPNESTSQSQSQEILSWEGDVSQSFTPSSSKKQSLKALHSIYDLLPSPTGEFVFGLSLDGHVSSFSTSGNSLVSSLDPKPSATSHQVLRSWIFRRDECLFLPPTPNNISIIIARLVQLSDTAYTIFFDLCDANGDLSRGTAVQLPPITKTIKNASLGTKGEFSCLTSDGELQYYQLSSSHNSLPLSGADGSVTIRPLGQSIHIVSSPTSNPSGVALLPLTSSHTLFASTAAAANGTGKLALELQIWDLKYGVPLASFTAGLPNASSDTSDVGGALIHPQLMLTAAGAGHAILAILPSTPRSASTIAFGVKEEKHGGKSVTRDLTAGSKRKGSTNILIIPYRVSKTSSLAAALLSRQLNPTLNATMLAGLTDEEIASNARRTAVLEDMRTSIKTSGLMGATAAVSAFWKWADADSILTSSKGANSEETGGKKKDYHPDRSRTNLPRSFVKELITILASAPQDLEVWATLRPIAEYLLVRRHVVTNSMLDSTGGVMRLLADRGDWVLVKRCLQIVPDLREDEIMRVLRVIVDAHTPKVSLALNRQARSALSGTDKDDTMDVDNEASDRKDSIATTKQQKPKYAWASVPHLADLLPAIVSYPLSHTHLRLALRRHFNDVESLIPVLTLLRKWLEEGSGFDWVNAQPLVRVDRYGKVIDHQTKREKKTEHSRPPEGDTDEIEKLNVFSLLKTEAGTAPLDATLSFLEVILDASFLELLQHPQGQRIIGSLEEVIKPEVDLTVHLTKIEGLLEPFSRAQSCSYSSASNNSQVESVKSKDQPEPVARIHARDNSAFVKIYQIEELEL